jgi:hypothetical protein
MPVVNDLERNIAALDQRLGVEAYIVDKAEPWWRKEQGYVYLYVLRVFGDLTTTCGDKVVLRPMPRREYSAESGKLTRGGNPCRNPFIAIEPMKTSTIAATCCFSGARHN